MGLILDTSLIIAGERRHHTVRQILEQLYAEHGETEIGLSVVSIAELTHGAYRATTEDRKQSRLAFINDLCGDVPVHPITIEIARSVGRIEGQLATQGIALSFEDLAIGVTALHLGYEVATLNTRHFERIPGLKLRLL